MSLEQYFEEINKYGVVSIYQSERDRKYSATIKLDIRNPGGSFEIKSGYGHSTVREAVETVYGYMKETLKGIMTNLQKLEASNDLIN